MRVKTLLRVRSAAFARGDPRDTDGREIFASPADIFGAFLLLSFVGLRAARALIYRKGRPPVFRLVWGTAVGPAGFTIFTQVSRNWRLFYDHDRTRGKNRS
jgi:hypothetical protein